MNKKSTRPILADQRDEGSRRKDNTKIDMDVSSMEASSISPRWAIPRPSLAVGSSGSNSRSQGSKQRGSASSQGSTSNHSTHSASSGSLLLSAANLAKVSNHLQPSRLNPEPSLPAPQPSNTFQNNLSVYVQSETENHLESQHHSDPFWSHVKLTPDKRQRRDTESIASSTHFTVVNGFTRHGRINKSDKPMWCCKSSHQITCLVVTMTILFTAGILAAICYVEMRQRKDIGSRYS